MPQLPLQCGKKENCISTQGQYIWKKISGRQMAQFQNGDADSHIDTSSGSSKLPLGLKLLCCITGSPREGQYGWYKWVILLLTFIIYLSLHSVSRPISVVKNVLHQNCTSAAPNCSSWAPFDQENYASLFGALDFGYLASYALALIASGHIAERVNMRYYLAVGSISYSAIVSMFGAGRYLEIHSFTYYMLIQVLSGIADSVAWPAVFTSVTNWVGKKRRGFIMSVWYSHTTFGNILGSFVAGAFVSSDWALCFIIPSLINCVAGIIGFLFLVPRPEYLNVHPKGKDEKIEDRDQGYGALNQQNEKLLTSDSYKNKAIAFSDALKIPGVVEYSLGAFFIKPIISSLRYWLPVIIEESEKLGAERAAYLATLFDFGGLLGGIIAGIISDRFNRPAVVCAALLVLEIPVMLIYQHFGHLYGLPANCVILLLMGMLANGPFSLIVTAVSAELGTHPSLQGNTNALATVSGIVNGMGSIGAALGPLLTGFLVSSGWQYVFYQLIVEDCCALLVLSSRLWKDIFKHRSKL